jgi:hypothetical protein
MKQNSEVGMRKWEFLEFGMWNSEVGIVRNAEVGMRKWELLECGSGKFRAGRIG